MLGLVGGEEETVPVDSVEDLRRRKGIEGTRKAGKMSDEGDPVGDEESGFEKYIVVRRVVQC